MMNVCANCGQYHADKIIDPSGPFAICPECGYKHSFKQLPLLMVSGASGSGKTTICQKLLGRCDQVVLMESDILWRPEFNTPETRYRDFFEPWLRIAKNISQSGRPVVLFGAGTGVPENIEHLIERRYFSSVRYLELVCSDEALTGRLLSRPEWRSTTEPAFITAQIEFNHWFKNYSGKPPVTLIDTTDAPIEETTNKVLEWIEGNLGSS